MKGNDKKCQVKQSEECFIKATSEIEVTAQELLLLIWALMSKQQERHSRDSTLEASSALSGPSKCLFCIFFMETSATSAYLCQSLWWWLKSSSTWKPMEKESGRCSGEQMRLAEASYISRCNERAFRGTQLSHTLGTRLSIPRNPRDRTVYYKATQAEIPQGQHPENLPFPVCVLLQIQLRHDFQKEPKRKTSVIQH